MNDRPNAQSGPVLAALLSSVDADVIKSHVLRMEPPSTVIDRFFLLSLKGAITQPAIRNKFDSADLETLMTRLAETGSRDQSPMDATWRLRQVVLRVRARELAD